jgi:hypothetical protein
VSKRTTWSYRIVGVLNSDGVTEWGIYEVYYRGKKPIARTLDEVTIGGGSVKEARAAAKMMYKDAMKRKPLLDSKIGRKR